MFARKFLSMTLCFVYFTVMLLTGCGSKNNENVNTGSTTLTSQTSQTTTTTQPQVKPQEIEGPYGKPLFTRESGSSTSAVPFDPVKYEANVKPYKVSANLSNIENLELFSNLTPEQKEFIEKNGFVVTPTKEEQLFYIYENNEYVKVPSFITTDSILQIYHVFYDYSLRTLENEKLYSILKTFNENMLKKSAYIYSKLKNEEVKKAALKNTAYFYVAQVLTGGAIPQDIPEEAKALGDKELKLITSESGFVQSAIFPYQLDYSQFKARGHYTRNEELMKYLRL
jgi:hypothetical protein